MDETALAIGRLEARADGTDDRLRRIENKQDTTNEKLDKLLAQHANERGEQRTRKALLLGGAGFFGWAISVAVEWLKK